jgi:limonene-1,2-epoxide hydrolase
MSSNETIIRSFIAAWSRLDAEELVAYFASDGTYHNVMLPPVSGRDKLLPYINRFLSGWSETTWEIINILSSDDIVMVERIDRTRIGERSVDLPCTGVFEMREGKIKVWRDYFDMATYTRAVA